MQRSEFEGVGWLGEKRDEADAIPQLWQTLDFAMQQQPLALDSQVCVSVCVVWE